MSAGKHTVYAKKINGSTGLGKAMAIGGGTPDSPGPLVQNTQYRSITTGADVALAASQCHGTLVWDPSGGSRTLTFPTVSALASEFPEWEIGTSMFLRVINTADAAENITLTQADSDFPVVGVAAIGQNTTGIVELHRLTATTGAVIRAST